MQTYEKVKEYGVKIMQLLELKKSACENEDYETAKRIKIEIDRIKAMVQGYEISNKN